MRGEVDELQSQGWRDRADGREWTGIQTKKHIPNPKIIDGGSEGRQGLPFYIHMLQCEAKKGTGRWNPNSTPALSTISPVVDHTGVQTRRLFAVEEDARRVNNAVGSCDKDGLGNNWSSVQAELLRRFGVAAL